MTALSHAGLMAPAFPRKVPADAPFRRRCVAHQHAHSRARHPLPVPAAPASGQRLQEGAVRPEVLVLPGADAAVLHRPHTDSRWGARVRVGLAVRAVPVVPEVRVEELVAPEAARHAARSGGRRNRPQSRS